MKGFIIFLALCTLTAAMVPRDRRAVHEDASSSSDITKQRVVECAETTPCAWAVYRDKERIVVDTTIINSYCTCKPETTCQPADREENLFCKPDDIKVLDV